MQFLFYSDLPNFQFITVPGAFLTIIGNWSSEKDRGVFIGVGAGNLVA